MYINDILCLWEAGQSIYMRRILYISEFRPVDLYYSMCISDLPLVIKAPSYQTFLITASAEDAGFPASGLFASVTSPPWCLSSASAGADNVIVNLHRMHLISHLVFTLTTMKRFELQYSRDGSTWTRFSDERFTTFVSRPW